MGKARHPVTESFVQQNLARGIVDVIVTANHQLIPISASSMTNHEIIGRRAVRALDDQIVEFRGPKRDIPLDFVDESDFFTFCGQFEPAPHRADRVDRPGCGRVAVVFRFAPLFKRLLPFGGQFLRRTVTTVSLPLFEQLPDFTAVEINRSD